MVQAGRRIFRIWTDYGRLLKDCMEKALNTSLY
jgi:hypothetical protein